VSPGCRLRRYHYVPTAFVTTTATDDVMIGRVVADFLVVGVVGSGGFGHVHHVLQLPLRPAGLLIGRVPRRAQFRRSTQP